MLRKMGCAVIFTFLACISLYVLSFVVLTCVNMMSGTSTDKLVALINSGEHGRISQLDIYDRKFHMPDITYSDVAIIRNTTDVIWLDVNVEASDGQVVARIYMLEPGCEWVVKKAYGDMLYHAKAVNYCGVVVSGTGKLSKLK